MKKATLRTIAAAGVLTLGACARVELGGPIIGATISIFHSGEEEAIYTTTTTEWGGPNRKEALLVAGGGFIDLRQEDFSQYTDSGYFIVTAAGGQRVGDDFSGMLTDAEDFTGEVHVIIPARDADIQTGRLNGLTELVYQAVKPLIDNGATEEEVIDTLDSIAASLVTSDITEDGEINYRDLLVSSYYDADPLQHTQDELKALAQAVFEGDAAMLAAEVKTLSVCNYTQTTPGGSFEVCETAHDVASCDAESGTFAFGACPLEGAVGVCDGTESSTFYYSGEASSLSFGCNFVPGGVWTSFE